MSDEDYLHTERRRLQDTAVELAKWQGQVETMIGENTRRLNAINGSVEAIDDNIGEIKVDLATLKTKLAIYSAIGGLAGSGAVTFVLGL